MPIFIMPSFWTGNIGHSTRRVFRYNQFCGGWRETFDAVVRGVVCRAQDAGRMTQRTVSVVIQRNPRAGARLRRSELLQLIRTLKAAGCGVRMFRNRDRLARWMSDPDRRAGLKCLVAAGGDGTVNDLATRYPVLPIAILPLGTENLLAKQLGLSRSGAALAALILAGRVRRFDLGTVGTRRFAVCASVGLDAEIVHAVHAARRGHITYANYLGPIWRALWRTERPTLQIRLDDGREFQGEHLLVLNHPGYALGLRWAAGALADDGRFDVRIFPRLTCRQLLATVWRAWWGTLPVTEQLPHISATRLTITSAAPVPVQVDGDPAGHTPVEISVLPQALPLIVRE
jgi:diacylglycerol kinase (ATP)